MKNVFRRFECKYLLTREEAIKFQNYIDNNNLIAKDIYPNSTIQSLYYDTPSYLLIRRSIDKPDYKEKIRIRTYTVPSKDTNVFLELKKKYNKIVFKRRVILPLKEAEDFLKSDELKLDGQIGNEINYFKTFYKELNPSFLIIYDRLAYQDINSDLRITFDTNIRYRDDNLSLSNEPTGKLLLNSNEVLMEIKTCGGYPLWLCKYLSENKIYKTSFSKYGTAYKNLILGGKK